MESKELVVIGKIERPFGVKGEVRVQSLSDVPGRFEALTSVTVVTTAGACVKTTVKHVRKIKDAYLVLFEGINTPEEAARLRGGLINIPGNMTPPLPPGQYYEFQLLGLTVVTDSGEVLGTLEEILATPGHHVFIVRGDGGEHLLPATKETVTQVDLGTGVMRVRWSEPMAEAADAV